MANLDKNEVVKELRRLKATMEKYLNRDPDGDEEKLVATLKEVCVAGDCICKNGVIATCTNT